MLDIYIRTRGWRIDYSVLLPQKQIKLNSNSYKSDIEKPTCILEQTEKNGCSLFLYGIPSQRKDHQGTPIRYDLLAKINSEPGDDWDNDSNQENYLIGLTKLIWLWLNEVITALQEIQEDGKKSDLVRLPIARQSELGERLDNALPEEYVEKLLQLTNDDNWTQDNKSELDQKLKGLLCQISQIPRPARSVLSGQQLDAKIWWGGVKNDLSSNKWLELVEKLLKGETLGKALLLNIATPQSLGRLHVKNGELGVLLAKQWSRSEPKRIESRDLPETKPKKPHRFGNAISFVRKKLFLVILIGLILTNGSFIFLLYEIFFQSHTETITISLPTEITLPKGNTPTFSYSGGSPETGNTLTINYQGKKLLQWQPTDILNSKQEIDQICVDLNLTPPAPDPNKGKTSKNENKKAKPSACKSIKKPKDSIVLPKTSTELTFQTITVRPTYKQNILNFMKQQIKSILSILY